MLVGEGGTHKKMAHCNSKPGGTKYGIKQVRYKGWIQNFKVFKGNTYVYNTTKWHKKNYSINIWKTRTLLMTRCRNRNSDHKI